MIIKQKRIRLNSIRKTNAIILVLILVGTMLLSGCTVRTITKEEKEVLEWYSKGDAFVNQGKYNEAIECYDKVLEIDPNHIIAWNNKGWALNELGRYSEAVACLDKALQLDPNLAVAWSNKGYALEKLGKYTEAQECYDKAKELNYKESANL